MYTRHILAASMLIGVAACTGSKTATEADFGNSKASLIKAQAANPDAHPTTDPVTGVDPDYAGNVIEALRENVSTPEEVQQPISIRVGGQQGSN
jgi:hypothetical protein